MSSKEQNIILAKPYESDLFIISEALISIYAHLNIELAVSLKQVEYLINKKKFSPDITVMDRVLQPTAKKNSPEAYNADKAVELIRNNTSSVIILHAKNYQVKWVPDSYVDSGQRTVGELAQVVFKFINI